jgi:hypothetical protein
LLLSNFTGNAVVDLMLRVTGGMLAAYLGGKLIKASSRILIQTPLLLHDYAL